MSKPLYTRLRGVRSGLEDNNLAVPHISNLTTRKGTK